MDWTVAIGIDTHRDVHVAVALDRLGAQLDAPHGPGAGAATAAVDGTAQRGSCPPPNTHPAPRPCPDGPSDATRASPRPRRPPPRPRLHTAAHRHTSRLRRPPTRPTS